MKLFERAAEYTLLDMMKSDDAREDLHMFAERCIINLHSSRWNFWRAASEEILSKSITSYCL
jgi:hypothetical protein